MISPEQYVKFLNEGNLPKYLVIAAVFWFNPLVSNVDILPDILGYLLVLKAFSRASYLYSYAVGSRFGSVPNAYL